MPVAPVILVKVTLSGESCQRYVNPPGPPVGAVNCLSCAGAVPEHIVCGFPIVPGVSNAYTVIVTIFDATPPQPAPEFAILL